MKKFLTKSKNHKLQNDIPTKVLKENSNHKSLY